MGYFTYTMCKVNELGGHNTLTFSGMAH